MHTDERRAFIEAIGKPVGPNYDNYGRENYATRPYVDRTQRRRLRAGVPVWVETRHVTGTTRSTKSN